ncbi:MAG: hypothetical protein H0T46_02205 [Deltaproteobacteria bacterium]|nr:hypothetical protein [Deltaproteobacteria bacterium]
MRTVGFALTLMICACMPKKGGAPNRSGTGSTGSQDLPPAPPPSGPAGPTCESAIASSMTLSIQAASDENRDALRAQLDAARPKMIAACHEDAWSQQLLDCLDKARTDAATGTCTDLLTPAQQDGVKRRLDGA